jgi:hypothetical protein
MIVTKRMSEAAIACLCAASVSMHAANLQQKEASKSSAEPVVASETLNAMDAPLRLADFDGMQPRAELRTRLTHITGFIQNAPNDGKPGTEETEVWAGYTHTTLYFVFLCHDHHPSQLRGHLARRENVLNDDNVSVLLDPFRDRRKGILLTVNPAGVQADAAWTENQSQDYSYDLVWDSDAQVTADGWMAMIAVPFRSLRFRAGAHDWGFVLARTLPRNSETDFWPRVAANVAGVLSQEGTLKGISGVSGSRNLQLNPYVLLQNERTLNYLDPTNPYFSARGLEGTGGGEGKLILHDTLVLDATVNPDFSDVESDQPQFTVNQRYPVYFPELRPFFLENANYFSTPIQLLYTRNIVHPEYGIRLTGKMAKTNIGFLAVDDREPGEAVPPGDPAYHQRAKALVGRVAEDVGKNSSIGALYTDEEFGGGWNRVGGVDTTLRIGSNWTVSGQMVESSTQGEVDSGNPPTYQAGPAAYISVQRSGHAFNLYSDGQDISPGFVTQLGFLQTSNIRSNHTHVTYQWFLKHSTIQSYGLEGNENFAFDHDGNRIYRYLTFDPFLLLPHNTVIAPLVGQNSDTLGPQNGTLFTENHNFTENFGGVVVRSTAMTQLNLNIVAIRGGNVNYNPVEGGLPSLLDQQSLQALITVQPLRGLTADNTYLLDRDHSVANGAFVYESQTFRSKLNYQFTRSLSARVIAQYDTTLTNAAETSLPRTKQIGTQALFTWLPHPGTAIYVGYNSDLQNLSRDLCNRLAGGACDQNDPGPPRAESYLNDGRQIFLKASYLIRF